MTTTESTERLKFSDFNGPYEASISQPSRKGCYVGIVQGFALVFLAVILAVSVGIIVHLTGRSTGSKVECNCHWPGEAGRATHGSLSLSDCQHLAAASNSCIPLPGHCAPPATGTTTPSTPASPTPPLDVRLPLDVLPIHYDVELQPDIYQANPTNFSFTGSVSIRLNCTRPTNLIQLHINKLKIINSSIALSAPSPTVNVPKWTRWTEDKARQFFELHLESPLQAGNEYLLSMAFHGPLSGDLVGMYVSSYKQDNVTKWLLTTQMQPTDARKAFPCFDEPGIKATFAITLVRKQHMNSLSNMQIVKQENRGDGWVADVYQDTVKMSTYLLAFVVCEFEYKENSTSTGTMFRVWARPDAINQVDYALDIGVQILEYFEKYFGIDFPLPKQDMIAVPDFAAGAMENWGLIIYRETALLYDPAVSAASNKQRVAVVVSHELAHQWFGNLVTPSWWDDLWLNEGFASYVEYLGVDHVHPDWKMMDQFITNDVQDVFRTDGLGSSHPIYVPVHNPSQINEIFDRISYGKGASVIRMMNHFLGESTFRKGLTKYLKRLKFSNAHHTDLWQALNEQATEDGQDVDVRSVMDTWVLQMGYPVVDITRVGPQQLVASQSHFLLDRAQPLSYQSEFNYTWHIPLTLVAEPGLNWDDHTIHWMHRNNVTISLPENNLWFMGNIGQYGYYRVNYDTSNWHEIIKQLKENHKVIPVKNRAQTIDDAFQLGRAGLLDQLIGLKLTEYLSTETEYIPWDAASTAFGFVDSMLARSQYYGAFKKYMLHHVVPQYERLGFDLDDQTPHLQKYLRWTILAYACKYGIQHCLDTASAHFKTWMDNPSVNRIHPDLKSMTYCNALKNGGEAEWNFAYEMFQKANVASEKNKLMFALACTSDPWLLSRFLEWTLNSERIRRQDATFAIIYVSRNPIGRSLAWDFVRSNWARINHAFGAGFFRITSLISGVTSSLNTEFELEQLEHFKENTPNLGSGGRAFEQAIEKTRSNVHWMKHNEDKIGEWLTGFKV